MQDRIKKKSEAAGKQRENKSETATGQKRQWGGKRPGAGAKVKGDYRSNLTIRCNPGQVEAWQAAADRAGRSLSEWIRDGLDDLAKSLGTAAKKPPNKRRTKRAEASSG